MSKTLAKTRPTAVNLFWAIERMRRRFFALAAQPGITIAAIKDALIAEARTMYDEDIAACRTMGAHGAALMPASGGVLTHCNAGALASCGYGMALGVIRAAVEQGHQFHVYADETRPFLQGARLTAWEMMHDGIPTTVLCDNMAASLMRQGKIQAVIVGSDRVAANGDVANKIGTYGVAILAKEHGIPFYVACPWSTIDLATATGEAIPDRTTGGDRSNPPWRQADDPARGGDRKSCIRRDPGAVCHRHYYRARHSPCALWRSAAGSGDRSTQLGPLAVLIPWLSALSTRAIAHCPAG